MRLVAFFRAIAPRRGELEVEAFADRRLAPARRRDSAVTFPVPRRAAPLVPRDDGRAPRPIDRSTDGSPPPSMSRERACARPCFALFSPPTRRLREATGDLAFSARRSFVDFSSLVTRAMSDLPSGPRRLQA